MGITVTEIKYIVVAKFFDIHSKSEFIYSDEECARTKYLHLIKHADEIELESIELLEVCTSKTKIEIDDTRKFIIRYGNDGREITRTNTKTRAEELIEQFKIQDEINNYSYEYEICTLEEEVK